MAYKTNIRYDSKTKLFYTYKTIGGQNKRITAKTEQGVRDKISTMQEQAAQPPPTPTFAEVAEAWQEWHWPHIGPKTQACYDAPLQRAIDAFGTIPIDNLTAANIDALILFLKAEGKSAKTIKTQKSVISQICSFAISQNPPLILINPCAAVHIPRGLPKTTRPAPDDSTMQIIFDTVDPSDPFSVFVLALLCTGDRRGELIPMTWRQIDFELDQITIDHAIRYVNGRAVEGSTKTVNGIRAIPLLPQLKPYLHKLYQFALSRTDPNQVNTIRDTLIWTDSNGSVMCESTYRRAWLRYCKQRGLVQTEEVEYIQRGKTKTKLRYRPTLTAHQLRHGYATLLYEAGIDAKTAQHLLGHADVRTTLGTYTDIRKRKQKNDINKLTQYVTETYKK